MAEEFKPLPVTNVSDAQREIERLARYLKRVVAEGSSTPGPKGDKGDKGDPGEGAPLPTPVLEGDIYYAGSSGATLLSRLGIPDDWAAHDYVLSIKFGLPAWAILIDGELIHGLFPAPSLYPSPSLFPEAP